MDSDGRSSFDDQKIWVPSYQNVGSTVPPPNRTRTIKLEPDYVLESSQNLVKLFRTDRL